MTAQYRPLALDEVGAAADLFLNAVTALAGRHGLPAPAFVRPALDALYLHLYRSGVFWAAEESGRLTAICAGVVRDDVWFLSMFWTLPERRQAGLGGPLVQRVFAEARERGARRSCTWSSIDLSAVAQYLKLGMMPRGPILTFTGEARDATSSGEVVVRPLAPATAAAIDVRIRGTARPEDHAFFAARGGVALQVELDSRPIGYFYSVGGAIGPAGWLEPEYARAVLREAIAAAKAQASSIRIMTVGVNHDAIAAALTAGLKLTATSHFMASHEIGLLDRYLPSGPGLF